MVHYVAAIQSCGSLDGFNTESPEWLHIDYAKEAYQASNKKDYVQQMMVWLGRQEAVARFRAYLDYVNALDPKTLDPTPPDDKTYDNEDNEDLDPEHTDLSHPSPLSLSSQPSLTWTLTCSLHISRQQTLFQLFPHSFVI